MKAPASILAASVLAPQAMAHIGTATGTIYTPIPDVNANTTSLEHCTLTKDVTMLYGNKNADDNSLVNVTLSMNYPSVILENIGALTSVDCTDDAVTVTFNDSASYDASLTEWFDDGDFVIITNHEGDCDVEIERGFFLVEQLTWYDDTLSVTASASRTNITETARTAAISFGGVPANTISKRDTILDPSYTTSLDLALPENDVLYTLPGYLEVVADEVSFETNLTFSGYVRYSFGTFQIKEMYLDLNVESNIDIAMTAEVLVAYSAAFTYAPLDTLTAPIVSVAGILDIGPAISFVAAAEVNADTPVNVSVSTSVGLTNASVHLDFFDEDNTFATSWVPTYEVTAEVTGEVKATFNPSATMTVEMEMKFFGGLIDFSSGITATPGFTNTFVLAADEVMEHKNGTVEFTSVNSTETCSQGLELTSNFTFGLVGFVAKHFSLDLYNTSTLVADKCLSWIS